MHGSLAVCIWQLAEAVLMDNTTTPNNVQDGYEGQESVWYVVSSVREELQQLLRCPCTVRHRALDGLQGIRHPGYWRNLIHAMHQPCPKGVVHVLIIDSRGIAAATAAAAAACICTCRSPRCMAYGHQHWSSSSIQAHAVAGARRCLWLRKGSIDGSLIMD